ncbi:hypothetical protein EBQ74_02815 [bacterium]|nr:hypothetical protein [bacterium]
MTRIKTYLEGERMRFIKNTKWLFLVGLQILLLSGTVFAEIVSVPITKLKFEVNMKQINRDMQDCLTRNKISDEQCQANAQVKASKAIADAVARASQLRPDKKALMEAANRDYQAAASVKVQEWRVTSCPIGAMAGKACRDGATNNLMDKIDAAQKRFFDKVNEGLNK